MRLSSANAGILFGQLCHGASWLLALAIAIFLNADTTTLPAIAWIHLVALGWITVTAFSILLHAIPAFLDVTWKRASLARAALGVGAAAIVAFVVVTCVALPALGIVATIVAIALLTYLATAWETLAGAFSSEDRIDRAVARAFAITLAMLGVAILLGLTLAWALTGAFALPWIARLPGAHANLALFGWLTLLGAFAVPAGVLHRSTNARRAPQAFVAAALAWLAVAVVLGAGVLLGKPWQGAYVFVALIGCVAQMVDAHAFHFAAGEPLDARFAWLAFALFQVAVGAIAAGLLLPSKNACALGALLGFCGWIVTMAALRAVPRAARAR